MSDERLNMVLQFVTALAVILGPVVLAMIQRRAAVKVAEVKQDLATSTMRTGRALEEIASTGEKTHALVNSERGVTLRALAVALRIIATDRPSTENTAAARAAEKASAEHEGRQAQADAGGWPS